MTPEERDHNQGQEDGSKASGFDAWVQQFNLFSSEHYNKGYEHGYDQKIDSPNYPDNKDDSSDSSSSDSNNSSSSSICLVSTACIEAMGLNDNCYELETLRSFRDNYLKELPYGLFEINNYNNIAPKIVDKIKSLSNSREYLRKIYYSLVLPCVRLINDGKNGDAFYLYKNEILKIEKELGY